MRRRILTVCMVVAVPVAVACGKSDSGASQSGAAVAQAGAPSTNKAADEAALRAIYKRVPGMLMAGDIPALTSLFVDDGVELMVGMPAMQGRDAINKGFASVFGSMKNLAITMDDPVVTVSDAGDFAVVKAPYRMSYTGPKGKKVEDRGASMTVFRKVNGQWKMLYDTNISEVAPQ